MPAANGLHSLWQHGLHESDGVAFVGFLEKRMPMQIAGRVAIVIDY
jgi:hypothetical protein